MGLLSILAGALNPVDAIEEIKDGSLKRQMETVGISLLWSQYITFLYETSKAIKGSFFLGMFSPVLRSLAASAYTLLSDESVEKVVLLSVSKELVNDKDLLDSIQYSSRGEKGKK